MAKDFYLIFSIQESEGVLQYVQGPDDKQWAQQKWKWNL